MNWLLCLLGRHDWREHPILTNDGWQDFGDKLCVRCGRWSHERGA